VSVEPFLEISLSMSALMLTADLMFSSSVSAAARSAEVPFRVASSTEALLQQASEADAPRLVILDLTTPGCDADRIVSELRKLAPAPSVVAYAPHVLGSLLQRARDAGCDQVLTRGQFDSRIDKLLQSAQI